MNSGQQRLRVRANDLLDLLLIFEDQEGRHGADAELLGNIGNLVDVELDEVGAGELLGEPGYFQLASATIDGGWEGRIGNQGREDVLYDLRGNDLAGTAPGREGIENDDLVVLNSGLELCFAVQSVSIFLSTINCQTIAPLSRLKRVHLDAPGSGRNKENVPRKIVDTHIDG